MNVSKLMPLFESTKIFPKHHRLCVYIFEGESTAMFVSVCILSWKKTKYYSIQTTHLSFKNSSSCYVLSPFSVSWEFSDNVRFNEENRPSSKVTERSQRLSWALNSNSSRQIFIIAWQSRPKWINGCSCVQKRLAATECSDVLKSTVLMARDAENKKTRLITMVKDFSLVHVYIDKQLKMV